MNLLLVNLTRFGDLLQTQPVVHGLRAQGHRVGLVCLENFAGAAALLEGVDHVAALPGSALLAGVQPGGDWRACTAGLMTWAERLRAAYAHDAVLNLTATLGGRLLGRLLAGHGSDGSNKGTGGDLRGFGLDPFGFGVNADPWSAFLQASTRQRGCSPFNLVDLFRMAAGVGNVDPVYQLRAPTPDALAEAGARLAQAAPPDHAGYVAMQLGASEERRRWPVAHFAALAARLWRELRLVPVLLGAGGERKLGERLRAALAALAEEAGATGPVPCIDLIGATSLPQLAATLRHMRMLVTNDTGTMHLAAGLDVPVLAIFLATAQPWDTGPYRQDCCCLEPALDCHPCPFGAPCPHGERCRRVISANTAFDLARTHLTTGQWPQPDVAMNAAACATSGATPPPNGEARVWRTLREANAEPVTADAPAMVMPGRGFMDLVSLSGHESEDRTRWIRLQRHFHRQFLDLPRTQAAEPSVARPAQPIQPPHGPCVLSEALRTRAADELRQADALLHLMGEQGALLRVRPSDMAKSRFLGTVSRVQALWDNSALFNVLGHLWLCESQGAGGSLDSVLVLAAAYRALVRVWLDHLSPSA
ncbi:glycosyltransferase family 9 protein [Nitratidesulfovibrio liaohensis]|uniref:Glycosyltransferase family 9 protein n=1 Tax=Nitratidesulfovibrio liaohensis TaxID=2604158 RepID=A0ABY9R616_9BACT|nr:glycosyltransferase family 9 protein [Nitratidesulfovibrio liaohensis]WMW67178.1 glycosyltransferase family 9 protein [Nitratidesulfovibrio liaohensis]